VAHGPNLNLPATASLSQRLEAFYQTAPATGQRQRFHDFCRASHFTLSGNRVDAAAKARIREQILRFSRGYEIAFPLAMAGSGADTPYEYTLAGRVERNVDWFADHFIEWVNAGLAAEGTH
jgi:hypothetical protein